METEVALYDRGMQTLIASWTEYARGVSSAAVLRFSGVAVAVFPAPPEREFYNNALLDRGLATAGYIDAVDATEATYAAARIAKFALWVHESDVAAGRHLERRGYAIDTVTRAMGMRLDGIRIPRPAIDFGAPDWSEYVRIMGLGPDYLRAADRDAQHILIARSGGVNIAAAMAFDSDDDCGIYNVGTLEACRRRGFGTALTAAHLHDALDRGCRTASLQSTAMAQNVYAAVGFEDLGRIIEYVPRVSPQPLPQR
jgi:ribosomal protein S18 acetylase RimI-like enzyme